MKTREQRRGKPPRARVPPRRKIKTMLKKIINYFKKKTQRNAENNDVFEIVLDDGQKMPDKEFKSTAGYDLYTYEDTFVPTGHSLIKLSFKIALPVGSAMLILARSGHALRGLSGWKTREDYESGKKAERFLNAFVFYGLIDPDFTNYVNAIIINDGEPFFVNKGQSVAQALFLKTLSPDFVIVPELKQTERGTQGFNAGNEKGTETRL